MITERKINKLLKSEEFELIDYDQVYIPLNDELDIYVCISYDAYAESDFDGYFDHETYSMKITDLTIDVGDKWIRPNFTKEELEKMSFSSIIEEAIEENYLKD